jgi:hypothetical protein
MYEVDQYTLSLLHFEDGIKDECGNTWSIQNNGVSISQAQTEDGSGSAYFNATGGIYTATSSKFAFGTEDFTIDFWMYYIGGNYEANFGNVAVVLDSRSSVGQQPLDIGVYSDYKICFSVCGKVIQSAPGVIKPNNWVHVACVRSKGIGYIFVDGKSVITGNQDANIAQLFPSFPLYLGGDGNTRSSVGAVKCYLDEFRISNIARWTLPNAPISLTASAADSQVTLSWNAVDGASGYNVKRSTTAGGPYTTIATNVTGTTYVDNTVTNVTTYYYVVTAIDGSGNESTNSNEASATPQVPSGHGLLRITMNDSSEREYKLSASEIIDFINWYTRTIGTGISCYAFNDIVDNSKEYLSFEKIISFKVIPLTN